MNEEEAVQAIQDIEDRINARNDQSYDGILGSIDWRCLGLD